jgi:hypothetical protein
MNLTLIKKCLLIGGGSLSGSFLVLCLSAFMINGALAQSRVYLEKETCPVTNVYGSIATVDKTQYTPPGEETKTLYTVTAHYTLEPNGSLHVHTFTTDVKPGVVGSVISFSVVVCPEPTPQPKGGNRQ